MTRSASSLSMGRPESAALVVVEEQPELDLAEVVLQSALAEAELRSAPVEALPLSAPAELPGVSVKAAALAVAAGEVRLALEVSLPASAEAQPVVVVLTADRQQAAKCSRAQRWEALLH